MTLTATVRVGNVSADELWGIPQNMTNCPPPGLSPLVCFDPTNSTTGRGTKVGAEIRFWFIK